MMAFRKRMSFSSESSSREESESEEHRDLFRSSRSAVKNGKDSWQRIKSQMTVEETDSETVYTSSTVTSDIDTDSEAGKESGDADSSGARRGSGRGIRTKDKEEDEDLLKKLRMVHIPPIPRESDILLTANDVQAHLDDFFGVNETAATPEKFRPRFFTQIVCENGRFRVKEPEGDGIAVELPQKFDLNVRILCIDEDDIIHCRYFEEETALDGVQNKEKQIRITSFHKLEHELKVYYGSTKNAKQSRYYISSGDSYPEKNEVVVVKVNRCFQCKDSEQGYVLRKEYQRARVLDTSDLTMDVELLDDYGRGTVSLHKVFKIKPIFAELAPQLFKCELNGVGFAEEHKLIHHVIRASPVRPTWPDCSVNPATIYWKGEYSGRGLPLVDVFIRTIGTPPGWTSLKDHVIAGVKSFGKIINKEGKEEEPERDEEQDPEERRHKMELIRQYGKGCTFNGENFQFIFAPTNC